MMTIIRQSTHDRLVRETANEYIREGYPVQITPLDEELPAFLRGFQPDMIVSTPDEKIVVQVNSKRKDRPDNYLDKLNEAIASQKGWNFRLVLDFTREAELEGIVQPVFSTEQIEAQLQASQSIAESGALDGALIVIWSTIEAILRKSSRLQGLKLPNQGSGPLITALYTDGDLSRKDYDILMHSLKARNLVSHGFQAENIDRSMIEELQGVAKRLHKSVLRRDKTKLKKAASVHS